MELVGTIVARIPVRVFLAVTAWRKIMIAFPADIHFLFPFCQASRGKDICDNKFSQAVSQSLGTRTISLFFPLRRMTYTWLLLFKSCHWVV